MRNRISDKQRLVLERNMRLLQTKKNMVQETLLDRASGVSVQVISMHGMTFLQCNGYNQNVYGMWREFFAPVHRVLLRLIARKI